MKSTPPHGLLAVLILVAAACTGSTDPVDSSTTSTLSPFDVLSAACHPPAVAVVDRLQDFVDGFAETSFDEIEGEEIPGLGAVQVEVQQFITEAQLKGCSGAALEFYTDAELRRLRGEGPVARAIVAALRGEEPEAELIAREATARPGNNLAALIEELGEGSSISLAAGVYEIDEVILIGRSLKLVGVGRDDSIIRSTAPGAALLVAGGQVDLSDLAVERAGAEPGSVIVVTAGSLDLQNVRVTGGRASPDTGADGHGLLLALGLTGDDPEQVSRVSVTGTVFASNQGAAVAVLGDSAPTLERNEIVDSGFCGICYSGSRGGLARENTIERNGLGVGVSGSASPTLEANVIRENQLGGVRLEGNSSARLVANRILDNLGNGVEVVGNASFNVEENTVGGHDRGLVIAGFTTGDVRGNTFEDNEVAILVQDDATPHIADNEILLTGSFGIAYLGAAAGSVTDNNLEGYEIGIRVAESATPDLAGNILNNETGVGVMFIEESGGSASEHTITGHEIGLQVAGTATPVLDSNTVRDATATGVWYGERAGGTLSATVIEGGPVGVFVGGEATPQLSANTIDGSTAAGIVYSGESRGVARAIM